MFNSVILISNLLQDPTSFVQYPGSEGYLAKCQSRPSQSHHAKLKKNFSFACNNSCTKFKSYRIFNLTIAVAEKEKYLEKSLWFLRSNQVKSSYFVNADISKNTGKKASKSNAKKKRHQTSKRESSNVLFR